MRRMRAARTVTATVTVAAVLALSACGSGGGEADDGAVASTQPGSSGSSTVASTATAGTEPPATTPAPSTTVATVDAPATDLYPKTPEEAAARIVATERAIRDPNTAAADLGALGRTQQAAYRAVSRTESWLPEVLDRLPADLRPVASANITASIELRRLSPPPKPEPPAWQIIPPAPADELLAVYKAAESDVGVPWEYLAAIHLVETRMGRIRGDSSAGAQGPMQFLPSTFAQYGEGGDIQSNHDSIAAAARMLRANGAPDDMASALYAYNHSQRYVRAVTAYAEIMVADERAYLGYHAWQVYYGDLLLPEGWVSPRL